MTIAAVPAYLGTDFSEASPGLRFGYYLSIWATRQDQEEQVKKRAKAKSREGSEIKEHLNKHGMDETITQWIKRDKNPIPALWAKNDDADVIKQTWQDITKLSVNDRKLMENLQLRQQHQALAFANSGQVLILDAIASAPFTTGLGNAHPLENGFAFLNPYGLPYLPGSGVKGVLRQSARELASGDWGDSHGWNQAAITALFGLESQDGETELQRGALTFWDVIPQIKGNSLLVEIMTPHQKHYYQDGQTPHDSGMPVPLGFLTVPPGSGFTFHVTCDSLFLRQLAEDLVEQGNWKTLLQAAFDHAFSWLGFGAKTAVGYGAMAEDAVKKAERAEQLKQQQEAARRSQMSPEDIAYEDNRAVIEKFRAVYEQACNDLYGPSHPFNSRRNEFIKVALSWEDPRSRLEAAQLVQETFKWGVSKKGKERLKADVNELKGQGN
ncbi:MAG: type III-B CRISPR module RAMP protein Cmr6 [Gammaproteobacteria bacterium]|nr:type III-B CRISPR module RAMP protein Cmr6 [Gammaproteobacteria bacterium]